MAKLTIEELVKERVLVLDGAMGTMIQACGLSEDDFRGDVFRGVTGRLNGFCDLLCLSRPEVVAEVHRKYLEAGADVIETNSFNASGVSMTDAHVGEWCREVNLQAARIARGVADGFTERNPERPRFVAGAVGPTARSCFLPGDVVGLADRLVAPRRWVSFDELCVAYCEQMEALLEGGVDALLVETIVDLLGAKAAVEAAGRAMDVVGRRVPLMLSVTVSREGRLLSGHSLAEFVDSLRDAEVFSVGINCSYGAQQMKPFVRKLAALSPYYVSVYPNAGLPNRLGGYDETPEHMAQVMKEFVDEGLVNLVGGCCGTTERYIAALARMVEASASGRTGGL